MKNPHTTVTTVHQGLFNPAHARDRARDRFFPLLPVVLLCVLCASSSFSAPQALYRDPTTGLIISGTDGTAPLKYRHGQLFSDGLAVDSSLAAKVDKTTTVNTHPLSANVTVTQADVGLGNVDNTSDANKPVSTAQAAAIALKVDKTTTVNAHPLSSNVTVTKGDVALGNVDNTSDANKPVSTAQQTALDLKVNANGAIISATKTKITYDVKGLVTSGTDATTADIADSTDRRYVTDAQRTVIQNTSGTNTGDQDLSGLVPKTTTVNGHALSANVTVTKSDVSLGNVDNTSDASKPVSTAQQTALDLKAPLASPPLTGTPTAPTAAVDTNTTQLATTAFVLGQAASATPIVAGTGTVGTSTRYARADHVHPAQTTVTGNAGTATALATGRTLSITGDLAWTSPSFDGTGNVTAAGTLPTVNSNTGALGSSTAIPTITTNGKGLVTAVTTNAVIAPAGTLSGATLASGVTASSLTSFGNSPTIVTPVINGTITGTGQATAATASTIAMRDANANITANNWLGGYTTTATAAGTTTLTVGSTYVQFFTGSSTQAVTLPVASTLTLGHQFVIVNNSTGAVTVNSSGGNAVLVLAGSTQGTFTCILTSGTTAASWNASYFGDLVTSGKKLSVSNTLTFAGTDGTTMTFPTTSAAVARTDAAQTFTGVQTMSAPVITSPWITTDIKDSNGNSMLAFTATASAVDGFTFANAATAGTPTITATGTDTNIPLTIAAKGTGSLTLKAGTDASSGNITFQSSAGTAEAQLSIVAGNFAAKGGFEPSSTVGVHSRSFTTAGLDLTTTDKITWRDGDFGTKDIGLTRNAAGVLEINNGTAATFRDLKARNINLATPTNTTGDVVTIDATQTLTNKSIVATQLTGTIASARLPAAIWARAYNSANISLTSGTPAALTFDSERYDTDTIHSTSSNTSRLTCKTAGVYQISWSVTFANNSNAPGMRQVYLQLNGATVLTNDIRTAVGGSAATAVTNSTTYSFAVNDYVELIANQDSGAALNVITGANYSPEFMMVWLGP